MGSCLDFSFLRFLRLPKVINININSKELGGICIKQITLKINMKLSQPRWIQRNWPEYPTMALYPGVDWSAKKEEPSLQKAAQVFEFIICI